MDFPADCTETVRFPKIVCKEKSANITFINRSRDDVKKIQIDNCVITDGIRCDWLVVNNEGKEHFVELKGGDVPHAIKQIERSVKEVSADSRTQAKACFIVSKNNPLNSTQTNILKKRFKDDYCAKLKFCGYNEEHPLT